MDKENKFYGLIKNLIEQDRRFEGLEDFLDEIADDVYNHSESAINSIEDKNVIEAYISRMVTISIINFSRKNKFKPEKDKKPELMLQQSEDVVQEEKNVDKTLIDKMINLAMADNLKSEAEAEDADTGNNEMSVEKKVTETGDESGTEVLADADLEDMNLEYLQDDESLEISDESDTAEFTDQDDELFLEDGLQNDIDFEENNSEISLSTDYAEDDDIEIHTDESESDNTEYEETDAGFELVEPTGEYDNTDTNYNVYTEDSEDINLELSEEDEEEQEFESQSDSVLVENLSEYTEPEIEIDTQSDLQEGFIDSAEEEIVPEFSDFQDGELDLSITESDEGGIENDFSADGSNIIIDTNETVMFDINPEEDASFSLVNDTSYDENNNETDEKKVTDFSIFNYDTSDSVTIYDSEQFFEKIQELDKNEPNLRISDICEMRFNRRQSVADIAVALGIDAGSVVDVLNKLNNLNVGDF